MALEKDPTITNKITENTKPDKQEFKFSISTFNIWCPFWNGNEHKFPKVWKKRHEDILHMLCAPNYNTFDMNSKNANENNDDSNNKKDDSKQDEQNDKEKKDLLESLNCDIYCIQEFWCDQNEFVGLYDNYLSARNYSLHFLTRNAKYKPDGIAIVINKNIFEIINTSECKYTISNRVAMSMELRHKESDCIIKICNTHLTFPQEYYDHDLRRKQCNEFIAFSKKGKMLPKVNTMMLLGDFNCQIEQAEAIACLADGYQSSYHVCNPKAEKVVSHLNHQHESVLVDHIFYKKNKKCKNEEYIFETEAVDSYLYPRHIDVEKWPKNGWKLSDHRPIVTEFRIERSSQ